MSAPGLKKRANLLLLDIGNSRVALSSWVNGGPRTPGEHIPAEPIGPVAEAVARAWKELPDDHPRAVLVSSVCPPVFSRLTSELEAQGIDPVLLVGRDIDYPITADVKYPDRVGSDRLCAAAGAFAKIKQACIVADFGTALTVDLVADNGVFLGGTILPGMALSARALHEHTALLPLVEVGATTEVLGKDTESAIRNGIFAMMAGALREISERYATEIGKWPALVVTGGAAEAIASRCEFVDRVLPDLCLDGILLAYQRQFDDEDDE